MPLLLYDGDCGLCNRLVRFIHARDPDGAFRFAPLGGPTARERLRRHGLPEDLTDTVVLLEEDAQGRERAHLRSEAATRVGLRLGGAWPIAARAGRLVPKRLRDAAYDLVARHRHRLFHDRACAVPEPALREKMLP